MFDRKKTAFCVCMCAFILYHAISYEISLQRWGEKKKKKEHRRICGDLIFYLPKWSRNTQDEEDIVKIACIYGL